jgi:ApaG protein
VKPFTSNTLTEQIRVQTKSFYVPERSDPSKKEFFFAYRIRITNEGSEAAQLVSRHWLITDAIGRNEEVRGMGVVGQQPRLNPGENYVYTSACPLPTEWGIMQGSYQMLRDDGTAFDATIGRFLLLSAPLKN